MPIKFVFFVCFLLFNLNFRPVIDTDIVQYRFYFHPKITNLNLSLEEIPFSKFKSFNKPIPVRVDNLEQRFDFATFE